MPAFSSTDKVNVTIDGATISLVRGNYSVRELAVLVAQQSATGPDTIPNFSKLTLVSGVSPAQASPTVNGSVALYGGEVLTSTLGS
jgi:hypothetical protein